jgi:DNA end-binding protein Ku
MTTEPTTARSIGTATMSLGLVSVPVKLFTTSQSADGISFNMLHDADGARLKQQHVCTRCNVVVDKDHTLKGYEHAKDTFVVFTKDEIEALDAIDDGQMTIREFIKPAALDPIYMAEEKTYYMGPEHGAELAYALVLESMEESGRIAIATYARRGKERLVAVRPAGQLLIVHELRYASEVRNATGVPVPSCTTKPPLLRIARQLITRLSSDEFVPERYTDSVMERRQALIKKKIEDGETITASPKPTPTNIADMLEALKASIDVTPDRSVKKLAPVRDRKSRIKAVAKKRKAS